MHASIERRRTGAERAAEFYRRGIARIEDRWSEEDRRSDTLPPVETAAGPDTSSSLYAADLDLFGAGSLFSLLSLARTRMGEATLAAWLLAPAPIAAILERQAALSDLRLRLDLREAAATLDGSRDNTKPEKPAVHPAPLIAWAESPAQLRHPGLRWLSLALAVAVAAAILWAARGDKLPFFTILFAEALLTASHRKQTAAILHATEHALEDLQLLASLLARVEQEPFASPRLIALQAGLATRSATASQAIHRLRTLVEHIHSLENPLMRLLDLPLLYSVQTAYAAEAWRRAHGAQVRAWLAAIGEIEALLSLSAYHYEHPADPFPTFVAGAPCFTATSLGHPLLPTAKCVRNDIHLGGAAPIVILSGSNMSGKSTLLRAIGINTVLAMAGAPVRASQLQLTPLHIGASILIHDSLQEGSSRFYAEITRLRGICALAEQQPPALFLLDELLQGTNSQDRLIGAEGVVRALLAAGAIGLLSTHDLALTHIAAQSDAPIRNLHLQDRIEDGRMAFDYKLQDGVVTKSNGIELMRLIGLKV